MTAPGRWGELNSQHHYHYQGQKAPQGSRDSIGLLFLFLEMSWERECALKGWRVAAEGCAGGCASAALWAGGQTAQQGRKETCQAPWRVAGLSLGLFLWHVITGRTGALICSNVYFLSIFNGKKKNESFQTFQQHTKSFKQWGNSRMTKTDCLINLMWHSFLVYYVLTFHKCACAGIKNTEKTDQKKPLGPERVWVEERGQFCADGSIPVEWLKYKTKLHEGRR